jgi:hypothetical protein
MLLDYGYHRNEFSTAAQKNEMKFEFFCRSVWVYVCIISSEKIQLLFVHFIFERTFVLHK